MSVQDLPPELDELTTEPEDLTVRRLVRAIDYAEGFWLGFAKSNTPAQRRRLSALCKDLLEPLKIRVLEIELNEPITDLLPVLRERLSQEANNEDAETPKRKLAIFVQGLERSIPSREAYPPLLSSLNLKRELFRQEVPHPLLLWLPDYALTALARKAPDFWAWRSGLYEFAPERDAAEQSLEALRGQAINLSDSLPEHVKRERLVMLKGLLDDYRELGDGPREQKARANILTNIGATHGNLGQWDESKRAFGEALIISRNLRDEDGEAAALNNLGQVASWQGEVETARRLYSKSLEMTKRLNSLKNYAMTLHNLAVLIAEQGEMNEAGRLCRESLEIMQRLDDQGGIAMVLNQLGSLAQEQGEWDEARQYYNESLGISKRLSRYRGVAVTLQELGRLAQAQGKWDEARRYYNESLEVKRTLGDPRSIAIAFGQLGLLAENEGNNIEAARLLREALNIFEQLGSPYAETARHDLARVEDRETDSG